MVKSRLWQIIYRSFEAVFGILCILVSIGVINSNGTNGSGDNSSFYLFFTNLSNYFVILYVFVELGFTIYKYVKGEKEGAYALCMPVKYSAMIGVLLTMVVANTMLTSQMGFIWEARWWMWLTNPFLHFFNPILFICDYAFFSPIGKMNKKYPYYSLVFPLVYLAFIYIRAAVLPSDYKGTIYPYPFLSPLPEGGMGSWWAVIGVIVALIAVFILLGYLVCFIDKKRYQKHFSVKESEDKK